MGRIVQLDNGEFINIDYIVEIEKEWSEENKYPYIVSLYSSGTKPITSNDLYNILKASSDLYNIIKSLERR